MFRKSEDHLITRALDEGTTDDATLALMRDGLADLREMPPMQMSSERLRDAILGGGLAPAPMPRASFWSSPALLVPVVAALAAAVVVPRLQLPAQPTIVPMASVAANTEAPVTLSRRQEVPPIVVAVDEEDAFLAFAEGAAAPTISVEPMVVSEPVRRRLVRRTVRRSAPRKSTFRDSLPPLPTKIIQDSAALQASVTSSAPAVEAVIAPERLPTLRAEPDGVVLLAEGTDDATGASAATEVDSYVNISVGG